MLLSLIHRNKDVQGTWSPVLRRSIMPESIDVPKVPGPDHGRERRGPQLFPAGVRVRERCGSACLPMRRDEGRHGPSAHVWRGATNGLRLYKRRGMITTAMPPTTTCVLIRICLSRSPWPLSLSSAAEKPQMT
jgi:hypothetical protein